MQVAVQERRHREQLLAVRHHVAPRRTPAHRHPDRPELGEGAVGLGRRGVPVALRRLVRVLHLKVVALVGAGWDAVPWVVRPIL